MTRLDNERAAQEAAIAAIKARLQALHAQRDRGEISAGMCQALAPRLERELLDAIAPTAPAGRWRRLAPRLIRALVLVGLPCVLVVAWLSRAPTPPRTAAPTPAASAPVDGVWYPALVPSGGSAPAR